MNGSVVKIRGGGKRGSPKPTWCITHQHATSGWPGTWGLRCALSQNDCVTMYKPGVVTMQGYGVGPCDPVSWHIDLAAIGETPDDR